MEREVVRWREGRMGGVGNGSSARTAFVWKGIYWDERACGCARKIQNTSMKRSHFPQPTKFLYAVIGYGI